MQRGDIWDAAIPGVGRHPIVLATRDTAIPLLTHVTCVLITSTYHGHVAEVEIGTEAGLKNTSAINCDNIFTLPKRLLVKKRGSLGPADIARFNVALKIALGIDD
jgi:mRNA interferase MazF